MKFTAKFGWGLALTALVACSNNGDATPDARIALDANSGSNVDATGPRNADASVTESDARMTTSYDAAFDASPPDASPPDASPPDATPLEPVTVTVYNPNGQVPLTGVPVAFLNADNSVVLETTTDSNGSAAATMVAGGSVTVGDSHIGLDGDGYPGNVYTWLDVEPGDNLVANTPAIPTAPSTLMFDVTTSTEPNAALYQIAGYCPDGEYFFASATDAGPTTIAAPSTCTTAVLYVYAMTGVGQGLGFIYQDSVAVSDGASIVLGDFAPVVTDSLAISNIPSAIALDTNQGQGSTLTDGTNMLTEVGDVLVPSHGMATGTETLGATANLDLLNRCLASEQVGPSIRIVLALVHRSPSITTGISFDLSTLAIATMQTLPVYDGASAFTWTEGTGTADVAVVTMEISSTDNSRHYQWTIVGPDTSASLVLPTLPASLSNFAILSTDTTNVLSARTAQITGGYDAIRNTAIGTTKPQSQFTSLDITTFPTGSLYVEALVN